MEKLITIASHPKVRVKVQCEGDLIVRITLFLSTSFVFDCPSSSHSLLPWLQNYAEGKWTPFPFPPLKTPFAQKAASFLQTVPPGQVLSYSTLAEAIGTPNGARAIGNFCQGNLFPLVIPCHRVIPSTGKLGAFTPDPRVKQRLLHFEGVHLR